MNSSAMENDADLSLQESLEKDVLEGALEAALLQAQKINEGANGIIAKVDFRKLPEDLRHRLLGDVDIPDESVIKLMKFYRPGSGKKEFEAQRMIHEALSGVEGVASVPKPYLYYDLEIRTPELRQALSKNIQLESFNDRVEVFIMDYIEGDDLVTQFFREIVRRHPRFRHKSAVADELTYSELESMVPGKIGYDRPGGKGKSLFEQQVEKQEVYNRNAQKLKAALKDIQFSVDPALYAMLKKTMDELHSKGIFHRDLHERNIMIGKDGKLFLIDFGTALFARQERYSVDPYEGGMLNDDYLLTLLESFVPMGIEDAPEELREVVDIDSQVEIQLKNARNLFRDREIEQISDKMIANIIKNISGSTASNLSRNQVEASVLWVVSRWDELGGMDAVRTYLNIDENFESPEDIQKTISRKILELLGTADA